MKQSWFTHTGLTTEEANELVARSLRIQWRNRREKSRYRSAVLVSQRISSSVRFITESTAKHAFTRTEVK